MQKLPTHCWLKTVNEDLHFGKPICPTTDTGQTRVDDAIAKVFYLGKIWG